MPEFRMPSLGADMDEGTLLQWLIDPGDTVHRGDVVAVVDTDKAAVEVECFDDGVVEQLLVQPGEKVPVGTVLASIGAGAAAAPATPLAAAPATALEVPPTAPAAAPIAPAAPPVLPLEVPPARPPAGERHVTSPLVRHLIDQRGLDLSAVAASGPGGVVHRADLDGAPARHPVPVSPPGRRRPASPLARRLAAEAGLDLAAITGTGRGGVITADDVRRAATRPPEPEPTPATPPPAPAPARAQAPPAAPARRAGQPEAMRRAIAALMAQSNRDIPHYYLTLTVDVSAVVDWLRVRNRELQVAERIVPAALLTKAAARAVVDVPQLNGHWVDDGFRPATAVDLGMVVSLRGGGIIVPVITDAVNRSVEQLMAAIRDLAHRARSGRLRSSELGMPSLTVTNLGDQGVEEVLGVIYPPQVALVGFGAVLDRPWAVDGLLGVRPVVTLSLAADHRASDGAIGARFLNRIDQLLQTPEEL